MSEYTTKYIRKGGQKIKQNNIAIPCETEKMGSVFYLYFRQWSLGLHDLSSKVLITVWYPSLVGKVGHDEQGSLAADRQPVSCLLVWLPSSLEKM